jgi:hypothetical protein
VVGARERGECLCAVCIVCSLNALTKRNGGGNTPTPSPKPTSSLLATVAASLRLAGHGSAIISRAGPLAAAAGAAAGVRQVPTAFWLTPPLLA